MQIVHRDTTDDYRAWLWADAAARHGWHVVSVVAEPPPQRPDASLRVVWHVYAEAPEGSDPDKWDAWYIERLRGVSGQADRV